MDKNCQLPDLVAIKENGSCIQRKNYSYELHKNREEDLVITKMIYLV